MVRVLVRVLRVELAIFTLISLIGFGRKKINICQFRLRQLVFYLWLRASFLATGRVKVWVG